MTTEGAAFNESGGDREWVTRAACAGLTTLMFPERGDDQQQAKAVCASCPVRGECLNYALENGIRHGIWGGCSEKQRRRMRAERAAA